MRLWYLGRAVPWASLLGCCGVSALAAVSLRPWPDHVWMVLPLVLAGCAGAAALVFDDVATAITSVTPRGTTWRRTTRLAGALVPCGVWVGAVLLAPSTLALDRGEWILVGFAASAAAVGLAAVGARRQLPRPGPAVAGAVVMLLIAPLVVGPFLDWPSVYPFGDLADRVVALWTVIASAAALLLAWALRPGLRP